MNIRDWLHSGKHLPAFMRDFHDQKLVFKWLVWDRVAARREKSSACLEALTFVDAQIFTIDFFLWSMATHGWTLQRSRQKGVAFNDIGETMAAYEAALREREGAALQAMFEAADKERAAKAAGEAEAR